MFAISNSYAWLVFTPVFKKNDKNSQIFSKNDFIFCGCYIVCDMCVLYNICVFLLDIPFHPLQLVSYLFKQCLLCPAV